MIKPYTIRLENGATLHDVGAAFGVGVEGLAEFVQTNHRLLVVREGGVVGGRPNARFSVPASWPDLPQLLGGMAAPTGLGDASDDPAAFAAFASATQTLYDGMKVGPIYLASRAADGTCYNSGNGYCTCPPGKFWITNELCAPNTAPPGIAEAAFQFWNARHTYPFSLSAQWDLLPDVASAARLYAAMKEEIGGRPDLLSSLDFSVPFTAIPWTWMLQHAQSISWKQIAATIAWTISLAKSQGQVDFSPTKLGASAPPLDWSQIDWKGLVPGQNVHWGSIWKFFDPDASYADIPWHQIPWTAVPNDFGGATTTAQVAAVVKEALETRLGLAHAPDPFPDSPCHAPKIFVNGTCVCPPGMTSIAGGGCFGSPLPPHDIQPCNPPNRRNAKGICLAPSAAQTTCDPPLVNDGNGNCIKKSGDGGGGGGGNTWPWIIGGGVALTALALFFGTTHGVSRTRKK